MLIGEENRKKEKKEKIDFTTLLLNSGFINSVVILSIEIILYSYFANFEMKFEEFLYKINLESFDLIKSIESYILYSNNRVNIN
jgi:hypothetical protein